jgi:hypothetical protein
LAGIFLTFVSFGTFSALAQAQKHKIVANSKDQIVPVGFDCSKIHELGIDRQIWRYMGGGEPAAYNHVVHYVYAARNPTTGDPGDVFYIRSTDRGLTFSAPLQLNSNTDPLKAQWEPSLSVSPSGTLLAVWYDERDGGGASTCIAGSNSPCYRMYARRSNDNGFTWLPDGPFSDVVSPLPAQGESGSIPTYVSDYDYAAALANKHVASWVDARVPINGTYQPDAFIDRELVNTPTPTPTSAPRGTPTPRPG